jgi:hypothetical protein
MRKMTIEIKAIATVRADDDVDMESLRDSLSIVSYDDRCDVDDVFDVDVEVIDSK